MTDSSNSTESDLIAEPPLVPVSDGIKSTYYHWQGPPLSDDRSCSSSGPLIRSVLTGRHESISAIARAEIGYPDYAVKFSPMAKGQARLEVARVTPIRAGPAAALPTPRRSRRHRVRPPDGLRTKAEAAAKLGVSIKTLNAHVASGDLHYVIIGKGTKRPRKMFTDADLDGFIANQTRKDSPCPSTAGRARPTGTSTFTGEVIDFTGPRKPPTSAKPRK